MDKLRAKYRFSIYRDSSFEEVVNFRLSRLNVFVVGGCILLIIYIIVNLVIAYTPLRELIPGYPDAYTRYHIYRNQLLLDSLENELTYRDEYIKNVNMIILGREPESYENERDTTLNYQDISFNRSREDSIIRGMYERENQEDITVIESGRSLGSLSRNHFFPPVKGIVTNSFNPNINHYGTDVASPNDDFVKATLSGTVIFSEWTVETGNVIQIQHDNNIVSIYKHNSELLKRVGDYVTAGEPIAIIGNSGELTSGTHLHFELWFNRVPLNPEDYVSF
ncbi:MAG: M23 family metallopeptidase [Bacteroidales bacterium]|nr:M23 family metallopeptidase [Bacteroidales bacterium]